MKKYYFILIIFIFSNISNATVLIDVDFETPPSSENNGGVYEGNVGSISLHVTGSGNLFDHVTGNQCWGDNGGCARFNVGEGQGGGIYRGFVPGQYSGGSTQLNVRYLAKWNSAWNGGNNLKGNILHQGVRFWTQEKRPASALGAGYQMGFSYNNTLYFLHGNSQSPSTCSSGGYECCPYNTNCNLGDGVAEAGPFYFHDYDDEWVCFEIETRSNGTRRLYIWTQDGKYNGLYMEQRNISSGSPSVTGFSGTYFYDSGAASGSYVMNDEVIFAEEFIGPPDGFMDGTSNVNPSPVPTPQTPQNLRLVQQ